LASVWAQKPRVTKLGDRTVDPKILATNWKNEKFSGLKLARKKLRKQPFQVARVQTD